MFKKEISLIIFILLFLISLLLWGTNFNDKYRSYINNKTINLIFIREFFSYPIGIINKIDINIAQLIHVFSNQQTKESISQKINFLEIKNTVLKKENVKLKKLLNIKKSSASKLIVAKVTYSRSNDFIQVLTLNKGSNQGINLFDVVLNNNFMIGYISSVKKEYAYVTLITDTKSNIPVIIAPDLTNGILKGENNLSPILTLVQANLKVGSYILTSGTGEKFRRNIPIGIISTQNINDSNYKVKLLSDIRSLHFVIVEKKGK